MIPGSSGLHVNHVLGEILNPKMLLVREYWLVLYSVLSS